MLYKPGGIDTDMAPGSELSVLISRFTQLKGIHHIGRLDRDTSGLLLLSNDGDLTHAILERPNLPKSYIARVAKEISSESVDNLRKGVCLGDGPAGVVSVEIVSAEDACVRALFLRPDFRGSKELNFLRVITCEGRNRIVRRMLASVGLPVLALHRERIGRLELDEGVDPGFLRPLTLFETQSLLLEDIGTNFIS